MTDRRAEMKVARRHSLAYKTIAKKEIDGIKYHYDIWEKDFERTKYTTIQKMGDAIFVDQKNVAELKIDIPIKFNYRAVHNEKVIVEEAQEYPAFIDSEDGLPPVKTHPGIQTKIEQFNPEFTVQLKIKPKNWGKLRRLMRRKIRIVSIPVIRSETEWQELLGDNGVWDKLTEEDIIFLTTRTDVQLRKWLFQVLGQEDRTKWGWRIQALFDLPPTKTKKEYYYEPVNPERETGTLKDVDIDVEVIGEDYETTIHIDKGGIVKNCTTQVTYQGYYFRIPVLPLICDWFNVPIPEEEKPRRRRPEEEPKQKPRRNIIKNPIRRRR